MVQKMPSRHEASRIFEMVNAATHSWSNRDLAGIIAHQLRSPLIFDPLAVAEGMEAIPSTETSVAMKSFGDLLSHPQPPVRLLELLKNYAKSCRNDADAPALPLKVATVLYYASIMLARVRCHQRITRMSDLEILEGVDWAIGLPWLPSALRATFDECRSALAMEAALEKPE